MWLLGRSEGGVRVGPVCARVLLLAVPGQCFCCGLFWLFLFVRFLFAFWLFFFILFGIAWWPSTGRGDRLSSLVSACAVLLYAVLIVCVPFSIGLGKDVEFDLSVPDHCLDHCKCFLAR